MDNLLRSVPCSGDQDINFVSLWRKGGLHATSYSSAHFESNSARPASSPRASSSTDPSSIFAMRARSTQVFINEIDFLSRILFATGKCANLMKSYFALSSGEMESKHKGVGFTLLQS